jgi:hypothetical protein
VRRSISRLVLVAALAATAAGVVPATAGSSNSNCPHGYLCLWTEVDYQGERIMISGRQLTNKILQKNNDEVSSLKFRKAGVAVLYEDADGQGQFRCFTHETRNVPDLSTMDWDFDNTASSSKIADPPGPCIV